MVAPTKIIAGLGISLGIDRLEPEGTTGDYRTLFHRKAEAVAQALAQGPGAAAGAQRAAGTGAAAAETAAPAAAGSADAAGAGATATPYEFAFLHVKAVDDAGHDRLVALKARVPPGMLACSSCLRGCPRILTSPLPACVPCVRLGISRLWIRWWASSYADCGRRSSVALPGAPRWVGAGGEALSCLGGGAVGQGACASSWGRGSWRPHARCRYSVVVTGDHSTPVEFGDHSHEPVPFAIAHVRHVVS